MDRGALKQILTEHQLKSSEQRLMILEYIGHAEFHPTADEIFQAINKEKPLLSRATVYNTLKSFVEKGVIQALDLRDHETRYDFKTEAHGHFRCNICGSIYNVDLPDSLLELDLPGFTIEEHAINFRGICPACQSKDL